jgi:NAD(P)-dependent dehydrogenase (short-subunit alcohol dehydrogenase family)
VSSSGHLRSPVVFDDLDFAFRDYDPFGAHGQSKTANVLFAVEATRRWANDGITANALMPAASRPSFSATSAAPRTSSRRSSATGRQEAF